MQFTLGKGKKQRKPLKSWDFSGFLDRGRMETSGRPVIRCGLDVVLVVRPVYGALFGTWPSRCVRETFAFMVRAGEREYGNRLLSPPMSRHLQAYRFRWAAPTE